MKIQGLAIIFILIILPIAMVIGEYAKTQKETIELEQLYDSRLITATQDALKAFQINTFNDANSDIADSKIDSIEASANAFYNSMGSSFEMQGYSKKELQNYVPALVYTMYDGYYIYSPYTNIADISGGNGLEIQLEDGEVQYGFKPYVYYSCRYVKGDIDVIINYSLDNYITVQGSINGNSVYKSGYLVTLGTDGVRKDASGKYYYNGIEIVEESNLTENLQESDLSTKSYKYIKLNGVKYYWDEVEEYIFHISGRNRVKQAVKGTNEYDKYVQKIQSNTSGISYYKEAYEFTTWVNSTLGSLTPADAKTEVPSSGTGAIFNNSHIEYPSSNFNLHRKAVIRYSIESNLSVAIANFNSYTNAGTNFQMPKLRETDWEMLENEISLISFLQGLNLGGKIYNGYTVVTNSKTEEVVKEERVYITTKDGYYHKITDEQLDQYSVSDMLDGVLDLDFEIRKDGATGAYYIHRSELGCYSSIVSQENVNNTHDSVYEYLQSLDNSDQVVKKVKQLYYTALGRERFGTYKIENTSNISSILDKMEGGTIVPPSGDYITASEVTAGDYGGYVTNYVASNASNADLGIGGWRIFHSDGTNIYLIADNYVLRSYIPNGKGGTTVTASGTYSRGFSLAPYVDYSGWDNILSTVSWKWLNQCYALGSSGSNNWHYNNNMKATAYLLDTNVWSGFKDSNGYASYAIGGPTIELFRDSYNLTHETDIDTQVTAIGYQLKWSTNASYANSINGLNTGENLYVISNNSNAPGMWVASPCAGTVRDTLGVRYNGYLDGGAYSNPYAGARPIICLRSNIQLERLQDGTYKIVQ